MEKPNESLHDVVIRFSGDSGDGMQLTGTLFSETSALAGNGTSTFPDYPAEIRAPQGTVAGVSGFQVHFGSERITNPGDYCDVLVAMNPAALKANRKWLKKDATVIIDGDTLTEDGLRKAGFATDDPQVWYDSVLKNCRVNKSTLYVKKPGKHTLQIRCGDPGVVIQKIVIDMGGLKRSYLGPESTKCN